MGTDGGAEVAAETDKYVNGPTGATIEEHVRESYGFLVNNYHGPSDAAPGGDEIFLFGFSRGAYTVRVLATLISDVGMLTSRGMEYFSEIFEDWKNMNATKKDVLVGSVKSGVFKGLTKRPKMPSDEYRIELYKVCMSCGALEKTLLIYTAWLHQRPSYPCSYQSHRGI